MTGVYEVGMLVCDNNLGRRLTDKALMALALSLGGAENSYVVKKVKTWAHGERGPLQT